ncbi:serine/threonine protein kinase [Mariniblastus fucicola]|uniref:Serine/threonine-protein kinase PrkC n=1 Tax=Mariniblastus fucicola TaxID=980251 RepID=A0A5B9PI82_9BACT|nr:serine/threonine-protein kinase [Mariniblastus fucicola]QEG24382.1 Serine/threonine-protein kinase PrkC [Mariniblastus fucicola]
MAGQSAKNLLKLLEKSGIADKDDLKESLGSLSAIKDGEAVGTDELTAHLIESGVITSWHAEKLLAGKYKGFFLDKYKLLGHLGTGGMSSVYLAESKNTRQKRAIKVLPKKKVSDKSYLDRFYREGKAAASLDHPNIVRVYDINNSGDTHYMVMEYVQGADLYETVRDNGPMPIDDAVDAIIQSAEGLLHAHEKEMVHRDVKPANLLRTESGSIKILDLGLALFNTEGEESLTVLYNEKVMGTADYLSPEQAVNSHEVDHRADIYSLGCTLYFLLTGRPPFDKGTLAQRIAMHQTKEPDSILESREDCPQGLVDICTKMMRKNPDDRFADCNEVMLALRQFRDSPDTFKLDLPPPTPVARQESASKETDTEPVAEQARGEYAIETMSASGSGIARPVRPVKAPSIRKRRRKPTPKWLVPALIIGMILGLVAVLVLVARMVG